MATFLELEQLSNDNDLTNKIAAALSIAAEAKLSEVTPIQADVYWAASVIDAPKVAAQSAIWAVLASNKDNTVAQITGATDAQIQSAVDAIVSALILAFNAANPTTQA